MSTDACVEMKVCEICDSFVSEQKKQLGISTYRMRKEHQKKTSSPTVFGQIESNGDSSDRGETHSEKPKKSFHKYPEKIFKAGKTAELKSSERFAWLEVMFFARSFAVPVELVQKGEVVVADRTFTKQTTDTNHQKQLTGATGQKEMQTATQPVEAAGTAEVTQPVRLPVLPLRYNPPATTLPRVLLLFIGPRLSQQSHLASLFLKVLLPSEMNRFLMSMNILVTKVHTAILMRVRSLTW